MIIDITELNTIFSNTCVSIKYFFANDQFTSWNNLLFIVDSYYLLDNMYRKYSSLTNKHYLTYVEQKH